MFLFLVVFTFANLYAMEEKYQPIVSTEELNEWIDNRDNQMINYRLRRECKYMNMRARQEYLKGIDIDGGLKKSREHLALVKKEINGSARKAQVFKCVLDLAIGFVAIGGAAYYSPTNPELGLGLASVSLLNLGHFVYDLIVVEQTTPSSEQIESHLQVLNEWKKGNRVRCIDN